MIGLTSSQSRLPVLVAAGGLGALALGCSLIFPYDDPVAERGAALCGDGLDNDFDGETDCESAACDGHCPELDAKTCGDARDNDGDGLIDGSDASCWPVVPLEVRRCAGLDPVDFEESFDGSWQLTGLPGWTWFGVESTVAGVDDATPYSSSREVITPKGVLESWSGVWKDGVLDGTCTSAGADFFCCREQIGACLTLLPERGRTTDAFLFFHGLGPRSLEPLGPGALHWDDARGVVADRTFELAGDFELSFAVGLTAHAALRVGLVPAATYAPGEAPTEAMASSLVAVEVETDQDGAMELVLLSGGQREATRLAAPPSSGEELPSPRGSFHGVRLTQAGGSLRLELGSEEGGAPVAELEAPAPELPPARLAISARTAVLFHPTIVAEDGSPLAVGSQVDIDDVRLTAPAVAPCSRLVPEIPFAGTCHASRALDTSEVGFTVGVARNPSTGTACLLALERTGGTGSVAALSSWSSPDARAWSRTDALAPEDPDATVTGAGVAYDPSAERYRAVVTWLRAGAAHLGVTESEDCGSWAPIREVLAGSDLGGVRTLLPPELESPSYVVRDRHEIYFTMPPDRQAGRTLWRATSPDGAEFSLERSPLLAFAAEDLVGAPVSVTMAGARDLVITYPLAGESGMVGLGALVAAAADLGDLRRASPWPLLTPSAGSIRFDGVEFLAGSVLWSDAGGLLLYGGRGRPFGRALAGDETTVVTVGSAELGDPTDEEEDGAICGDGACVGEESCTTCETDCGACPDGELVFSESFESGSRWSLGDQGGENMGEFAHAVYAHPASQAAYWTNPRGDAWYVADLPRPLSGDFELRAKVRSIRPPGDAMDSCALFVGLSTPTDGWWPVGYFLRMMTGERDAAGSNTCLLPSRPAFVPFLSTESNWIDTVDSEFLGVNQARCVGVIEGRAGDVPYDVFLRRRTGRVTLSVRGPDGCSTLTSEGESELVLDGQGTVGPVTQVSIGFGPYLTRYCGASGLLAEPLLCPSCTEGTGWVDDIEVWALDCDDDARGNTQCADPTSGAISCVDTAADPNHCGGCFQACAPLERCVSAACECLDGLEACPGVGCVDLLSDPGNCGACGVGCPAGVRCLAGACDPPANCAEPATLPPQGGWLEVDLARYPAEPSLSFPNAVVLTWKPSRSGTVTLRSHDSFLTEGLHTQIRASEGTACPPGQFFDADWISESLEFSVDADVTYHILLGTSDAIPEDEAGLVYLEITFE